MNSRSIALGTALAFITEKIGSDELKHLLADGDIDFVEQLRSRVEVLENSHDLAVVSADACRLGTSLLATNEAVVLAFFAGRNSADRCSGLATHMNNCTNCLGYFAQVLRDFHHAKSGLASEPRGR